MKQNWDNKIKFQVYFHLYSLDNLCLYLCLSVSLSFFCSLLSLFLPFTLSLSVTSFTWLVLLSYCYCANVGWLIVLFEQTQSLKRLSLLQSKQETVVLVVITLSGDKSLSPQCIVHKFWTAQWWALVIQVWCFISNTFF